MRSVNASLQGVLEQLDWPNGAASELTPRAHLITHQRGAIIFHAGEPADLLYVLLSGEVKLYYGDADGQRLLVGIVRSGQILGFPDLESGGSADDESVQLFTAEALSQCTIAIVAKAQVAQVVSTLEPRQVTRMMRQMHQQWSRLCDRFLTFLIMDVRTRLAYAIEDIAQQFGTPDARGMRIRLKLSHEDFGELVGASRPMVSKHLKEFANAGIFFKQDGRYILSRAEALRRLHRPGQAAAVAACRPKLHAAVGRVAVGARQVRATG